MTKLNALAVVVALCAAGSSQVTQAADTTLTLACQGTMTTDTAKPVPVTMSFILNFTNRTLQGFGYPGFLDYPVKITAWNDVTVAFSGSTTEKPPPMTLGIAGSLDRVTGDLEATDTQTVAGENIHTTNYKLKCRRRQRMF